MNLTKLADTHLPVHKLGGRTTSYLTNRRTLGALVEWWADEKPPNSPFTAARSP